MTEPRRVATRRMGWEEEVSRPSRAPRDGWYERCPVYRTCGVGVNPYRLPPTGCLVPAFALRAAGGPLSYVEMLARKDLVGAKLSGLLRCAAPDYI